MKKYLLIIKSNIFWILIAGIILYWGINNDGYIRIGIGLFILFLTLRSIINDIKYAAELNNWIKKNQGELILFYPTKKTIQDNIKNKFIPKLPYKTMEVYYDGPKLIGDIKRSIVFEMIRWNPKINIHTPAILKVVNDFILAEELDELRMLDLTDNDYQKIIKRIEKINGI